MPPPFCSSCRVSTAQFACGHRHTNSLLQRDLMPALGLPRNAELYLSPWGPALSCVMNSYGAAYFQQVAARVAPVPCQTVVPLDGFRSWLWFPIQGYPPHESQPCLAEQGTASLAPTMVVFLGCDKI